MRIQVAKDESEWVEMAWTWIHRNIEPAARVFVPAGGTPTPLYRRLSREPSELVRGLRLVQIDEILTGPQKGSFAGYFRRELAPYQERMEWIGGSRGSA
ncbi:MAG: hypothetical protein HC902_09565, partial [Calothrix sp. SM1_5_4]|nr:hypothetical protein [Calothrix sp. SM1_5_4]